MISIATAKKEKARKNIKTHINHYPIPTQISNHHYNPTQQKNIIHSPILRKSSTMSQE